MRLRRILTLMGMVVALLTLLAAPSSAQDQDNTGYWMLAANGDVYQFGAAQHYGDRPLDNAIDIEPTPDGGGYFILQQNGSVWEYGNAAVLTDPAPRPGGDSWASLTSTQSGEGFWTFSERGCVAVIGDAQFHGDMCGRHLNAPIVGSTVTPSGDGYYMVAKDGGIFSFGNAPFYGSTGSTKLNQPVVGMAVTPTGGGYWLVAEDGGIFAFGDATFYGSMGGTRLNQPVTGIVTSPTGGGYLLVARDGGIFTFGDVQFRGSLGSTPPPAGVVSAATLPVGTQDPEPPEPNEPQPPDLRVIPNIRVDTDDAVNIQTVATDPDGDELVYSATGLPGGLTINAETGVISGTVEPGIGIGDYQVTVTVTDEDGLTASRTFILAVFEAQNPPPPGEDCDESYPDVCIPPAPPLLNCGDITERQFTVTGPDPHGFDGDNDGIGCEG